MGGGSGNLIKVTKNQKDHDFSKSIFKSLSYKIFYVFYCELRLFRTQSMCPALNCYLYNHDNVMIQI